MTTSPKKITKIDSSLRSESLSGISNSERLVKNLCNSHPHHPVHSQSKIEDLFANVNYCRLKNRAPMQCNVFSNGFCMVPRFFVPQNDPEKGLKMKKYFTHTVGYPINDQNLYKDSTPSRGSQFIQTYILPKEAL